MAVLDHQEQEQVEAIKSWWQENGRSIMVGAGIGVAVLASWQGWREYKASQSEKAAALYAQVQTTVTAGDAKKARNEARGLMEQFGGSPYAPRAALLSAKAAFDANDLGSARADLQWVLDHASEAELKDLARLRLARVALDEGKHDEALKLVDAAHAAAFDGLYLDLKGDVLSAQGKRDEARAAYQAAYDKFETGSRYRSFIEFKLDFSGGRR